MENQLDLTSNTNTSTAVTLISTESHCDNDQSLPQEILDQIIDRISDDKSALNQCCLAGRSLYYRSRRHLFRVFRVTGLPKPFSFKALANFIRTQPSFHRNVQVLHLDGYGLSASQSSSRLFNFSEKSSLHPEVMRAILCGLPMVHTLHVSGLIDPTSIGPPGKKPNDRLNHVRARHPADENETPVQPHIITTIILQDTNIIDLSCKNPRCRTPVSVKPTTIEMFLGFPLCSTMKAYLSVEENRRNVQTLRLRTTAYAETGQTQTFGHIFPQCDNVVELSYTVEMESWRSVAGFMHLLNALDVTFILPQRLKRLSFHFIFKEGDVGKQDVRTLTDLLKNTSHRWPLMDDNLQEMKDLENVTFSAENLVLYGDREEQDDKPEEQDDKPEDGDSEEDWVDCEDDFDDPIREEEVKTKRSKYHKSSCGLDQEQKALIMKQLPLTQKRGIVRFA